MDFLINYYVSYIIEKHIALAVGFFLWHAVCFICLSLIMFFSVKVFTFLKNKIEKFIRNLCNIDLKYDNNSYDDCIRKLSEVNNKEKFFILLNYTAAISVIFLMWLIIPLSVSFFTVKKDIGIVFFISIIFLPLVFMYIPTCFLGEKQAVKIFTLKFYDLFKISIPFVISTMSAVVLSGTFSFRDVVSCQSANGIFSWYIFPAFFSVLIISYCIAAILKNYETFSPAEYLNKKIYIFFKNSYILILLSFLVILFFGGYLSPLQIFIADAFKDSSLMYSFILSFEQIFWIFLKSTILFIIIVMIKVLCFESLNSMIKNINNFLEKYLTIISLINLLLISLYVIKFGEFYVG